MSKPKVMVALRDAKSVEGLVKLACQLANGMEADLIALHVVEVPMVLDLDADAEVLDKPGKEILARAKRVAEDSSKPINPRLVRARQAGEAIVEDVKEQGVDLLVMGYHQPHRVGEILLGSVVQYVARHAPCRVIVQIPPLNRHQS